MNICFSGGALWRTLMVRLAVISVKGKKYTVYNNGTSEPNDNFALVSLNYHVGTSDSNVQ